MSSAAPIAHAVAALEQRFQKIEAGLACAESRLSREMSSGFAEADARLNPLLLIERLARLEKLVPTLRQAAASNADAWRAVGPDAVLGLIESNHSVAAEIASRADADDAQPAAEYAAARSELPSSRPGAPTRPRGGVAGPSSVFGSPPPAPPLPESPLVAAPRTAQPASAAAPQLAQLSGRSHVSQLQWLRAQGKPDGLTLEETDEFFGLLQGICHERDVREVQAAQLLALGIRLTAPTLRKLGALEAMGLLKREQNCIRLL